MTNIRYSDMSAVRFLFLPNAKKLPTLHFNYLAFTPKVSFSFWIVQSLASSQGPFRCR